MGAGDGVGRSFFTAALRPPLRPTAALCSLSHVYWGNRFGGPRPNPISAVVASLRAREGTHPGAPNRPAGTEEDHRPEREGVFLGPAGLGDQRDRDLAEKKWGRKPEVRAEGLPERWEKERCREGRSGEKARRGWGRDGCGP